MTNETKYVARRRRKVLAVYIDYLLFFSLLGLAVYWGGAGAGAVWLGMIPFVALEFIAVRQGYSPGYFFLSMSRELAEDGRPVAMVDAVIKDQEHWLTLLVGMTLIMDGTKEIGYWTMGLPVMPVMGVRLDFVSGAVYSLVSGLVSVYLGYCVLKLKRQTVWIMLALLVFSLVSLYLSWPLLPKVVEEMVIRRHELVGTPVREGEIANMQSGIPLFTLVFFVLNLLFLVFFRKKFTREGWV